MTNSNAALARRAVQYDDYLILHYLGPGLRSVWFVAFYISSDARLSREVAELPIAPSNPTKNFAIALPMLLFFSFAAKNRPLLGPNSINVRLWSYCRLVRMCSAG